MPETTSLAQVGTAHFLALSAVLFGIGVAGVLTRRNVFIVLMSLEIMLNAVNLSFVTFARLRGDATGHLLVLFVIAVAAAEVCVGLAILVALYRQKESVDLDLFSKIRG